MDYFKLLSISMGGIIGSILRYKISTHISQKTCEMFPYGTILINISGSFFLGCVVSLNKLFALNQYHYLFLTMGFAGAFTTFSTAMYEQYKLLEDRQIKDAVLYFTYTMAGGITASILGYWVIKIIFA
jgi:fluoride exporter